MSVPPFNAWLLPMLRRVADGETHALSVLSQQLAEDLGLSPEDRAQMLSSGQSTYQNRVGWARTYLKKARLIEAPSRGTARITERGRQVLAENLAAIDVKYLYRFPEFVEFHTPAEDPKLLVAIAVDSPPYGSHYGGFIAAPAFGEIAKVALPYLGVPPDSSGGATTP